VITIAATIMLVASSRYYPECSEFGSSRYSVTVRVLVMLDIYFVSVKYVLISVKLMCVYVKLLKI
jgi:uncharacterized membrane protein YjgN (DUF898 family)